MTTNNHPAHGPVSLDRLHQIREILSKAAAQSDGGNLGYAMADAVKVIDGAIAAFGAEPGESSIFDAAIDICRKSDAIDEHAWNHGVLAVMSAFRACRAAMLQAVNSPVTPDGWISVSDRVPPNKPGSYEYIVFDSLNNKAHHDYWNVPDGSCDDFSPFWNHYGKYVTHWMPLPAAPQQEVKS
ncbi:DUF551 domain-containing protein [Citrobacter freundii]|uniref:DUF551 domain-containing protein n=1 Tax=Citrobacter freundii TaxID=546 RepID=UPI0028E0A693|nr:DUF551 domain-containing protein [Citrobacter freundii]MDT9381205.1 DUF551 domain-containing protein [Citrobacter freundii]